jgi:uncharacterized protein (TIGR04255 family)
MTVKFRNPPINELVIGVYFTRDLQLLRAEHVGLFWSSIRSEFPTIQQQPIVVPPFAPSAVVTIEFAAPGEMFPMPRFWIESTDGQTLLQIQRNAFLLNWRLKGINSNVKFVIEPLRGGASKVTRFLLPLALGWRVLNGQ